MSFADSLKGLVGKGKDMAAKNADKIHDAVDKAGDFVDEKTGGKYSDHIDKVQDAAKKAVPLEDGAPVTEAEPAPAEPPVADAGPAAEQQPEK